MFADVATAKEILDEYFNEPGVELLLRVMYTAIGFESIEGSSEPALGATRIGGMPDLATGEPWPVRPVPADAEAIAARSGSRHGPHIRKLLALPLPFGFLAQVNLAEAAALGDVARELPKDGRLLFFYNGGVGPWRNGRESARVIWDTTAAAQLERKALPRELVDLHVEFCTGLNRGEPPPDPSNVNAATPSYHWGPARPMRLRPMLRPPSRFTIETDPSNHEADAELVEALGDDDFEASIDALFDDHLDGAARQQLLGLPLPQQADPRYSAVTVTEFGVQHLTRQAVEENWPRIVPAAGQWLLLLQIDLKDCLRQRFVEGTVYFLIRRDDLAARAFDKVVAVYQQT
jgi:Domain of unknown function (DUF1963)